MFAVNKKRMLADRKQEIASMFNSEDELVEDKASVLDTVMKYNEDLLSRNEHPPEVKDIAELKKQMMDLIQETEISKFETISEEEFARVVQKIKRKTRDFIDSSDEFKYLIYQIVKMIYEDEDVPEDLLKTTLVMLFKKGDPRRPPNYRFLHVKEDVARILEYCVYLKLEVTFDTRTPEIQLGGMKKSSMVELLVLMMSLIKNLE